MLSDLKNYLLNVLARAIVSYIMLLILSFGVLILYTLLEDFESAIKFFGSIVDSSFGMFMLMLPLFFSFFKVDKRGHSDKYSSVNNMNNFFTMYDTNNGKW